MEAQLRCGFFGPYRIVIVVGRQLDQFLATAAEQAQYGDMRDIVHAMRASIMAPISLQALMVFNAHMATADTRVAM